MKKIQLVTISTNLVSSILIFLASVTAATLLTIPPPAKVPTIHDCGAKALGLWLLYHVSFAGAPVVSGLSTDSTFSHGFPIAQFSSLIVQNTRLTPT